MTARTRSSRVALALAVPAVLVGLAACSGTGSGYAPDPPPPSYGPANSSKVQSADDYGAEAPSSQAPVQQVAAAAPPSAPASAPAATAAFDGLKPGDSGPQVKALQDKLESLHFWVGTDDGNYGLTTTQAVIAVQKAAGISADGVMGKDTRQALANGVSVSPESSSGHVVEINKSKQLAMIVQDGQIQEIFHTSTGSGQQYTSEGQTSVANTPSGHFTMFRQVDALDKSPLGELWRPKYFNGGIALHGDGSVPPYPASHGCARISNPAIDWIWANNEAPMGTPVWVY